MKYLDAFDDACLIFCLREAYNFFLLIRGHVLFQVWDPSPTKKRRFFSDKMWKIFSINFFYFLYCHNSQLSFVFTFTLFTFLELESIKCPHVHLYTNAWIKKNVYKQYTLSPFLRMMSAEAPKFGGMIPKGSWIARYKRLGELSKIKKFNPNFYKNTPY